MRPLDWCLVVLFIIINTITSEFLINRASSWAALGAYLIILAVTAYFFLYKPLKRLL